MSWEEWVPRLSDTEKSKVLKATFGTGPRSGVKAMLFLDCGHIIIRQSSRREHKEGVRFVGCWWCKDPTEEKHWEGERILDDWFPEFFMENSRPPYETKVYDPTVTSSKLSSAAKYFAASGQVKNAIRQVYRDNKGVWFRPSQIAKILAGTNPRFDYHTLVASQNYLHRRGDLIKKDGLYSDPSTGAEHGEP